MNRLEIIHLRLAGTTPSGLVEDIRRAIDTDGTGPAAHIYRHATLTGDLSIHLQFEFAGGEHHALGEHLAHAMKEHGMVEHTVWLEERTPLLRSKP